MTSWNKLEVLVASYYHVGITTRVFIHCHASLNEEVSPAAMPYTLEISDELKEKIDGHLEEGESHEEFIAELVSMYETEGAFLQEGYSE